MSTKNQATDREATVTRAQHGARSEVTWEGGSGRQPYTNQGEQETGHTEPEFSGGGRGDLSGRNQEQLEEAKKKP